MYRLCPFRRRIKLLYFLRITITFFYLFYTHEGANKMNVFAMYHNFNQISCFNARENPIEPLRYWVLYILQ